eukprot:2262071-Rhodomonas_salina.1
MPATPSATTAAHSQEHVAQATVDAMPPSAEDKTTGSLEPVDTHSIKEMVDQAVADIEQAGRHGLHLHDILHKRFIHTNGADIVRVTRDDVPTLSFEKTHARCADCMTTKSTRQPRGSRSQRRAARPLELIHMDIAGLFKHSTQGGEIYFLVLVDDCWRKAWVYLLSKKSQAAA